jgi:hypothetical protein
VPFGAVVSLKTVARMDDSFEKRQLGPRLCCIDIRAGSGLNNAGLGRAQAFNFGLGLFAGLGTYLVFLGSGFY